MHYEITFILAPLRRDFITEFATFGDQELGPRYHFFIMEVLKNYRLGSTLNLTQIDS